MKQPIPTVSGPIRASVMIPGSKSMTNRALLLAALADGVSEISGILLSDDTLAFMQALRELGIFLQLDEAHASCIVAGCRGQFPKTSAKINCQRAGTAARFIVAALAGSPGRYEVDADPQLRTRPLTPLLDILRQQGAEIQSQDAKHALPLVIQGCDRMHGGEIEIDSEASSQFVSALLMAAPYAKEAVVISANDTLRHAYVDMTCEMMGDFGVLVRRMHKARFMIPAAQHYQARDYAIEPDLATASYFFAAAAITGGKVTMQPLDRRLTKQGDVYFLDLLENMGCVISETIKGLGVQAHDNLKGIDADMRLASDTFMTLAAIAPFAKTPTTLRHIGHTRGQESDRIHAMCEGLKKMHVAVEEGEDWIKIYPSDPKGAEIDSHQDHRIAMAFSVMGLRVPGVVIDGAECVSKTCPDFYERFFKLAQDGVVC